MYLLVHLHPNGCLIASMSRVELFGEGKASQRSATPMRKLNSRWSVRWLGVDPNPRTVDVEQDQLKRSSLAMQKLTLT